MEESNNSKKMADLADKSLLIVDDDNPLRDRLSRAMEKKGFLVKGAKTEAEAIDIIQKKRNKIDVQFKNCKTP